MRRLGLAHSFRHALFLSCVVVLLERALKGSARVHDITFYRHGSCDTLSFFKKPIVHFVTSCYVLRYFSVFLAFFKVLDITVPRQIRA